MRKENHKSGGPISVKLVSRTGKGLKIFRLNTFDFRVTGPSWVSGQRLSAYYFVFSDLGVS